MGYIVNTLMDLLYVQSGYTAVTISIYMYAFLYIPTTQWRRFNNPSPARLCQEAHLYGAGRECAADMEAENILYQAAVCLPEDITSAQPGRLELSQRL